MPRAGHVSGGVKLGFKPHPTKTDLDLHGFLEVCPSARLYKT